MSLVILYKGRRGAGKTLSMVKDGYRYKENGYRIFSNFGLKFAEEISNDDILKLDKNSDIYDCVILIDEVQIFFDSRRSMKKEAMNFSNFIQQIRKRNITILGTTQYSNTVDLRFRQHTDIVAHPNFIKSLKVCEVTYIDMTSLEDMSGNQEPRSVKIVYNPIPIFKLYDTTKMIK